MTLSKKTIAVIGWTGTILLMLGYGINTLGFISSTGLLYAIINIIAAVCLGIRVLSDKNWSNVSLEIFWVIIGIVSIIRHFWF